VEMEDLVYPKPRFPLFDKGIQGRFSRIRWY